MVAVQDRAGDHRAIGVQVLAGQVVDHPVEFLDGAAADPDGEPLVDQFVPGEGAGRLLLDPLGGEDEQLGFRRQLEQGAEDVRARHVEPVVPQGEGQPAEGLGVGWIEGNAHADLGVVGIHGRTAYWHTGRLTSGKGVCQYANQMPILSLKLIKLTPAALWRPVLGQVQQLREGFGMALVVFFMVGFFWGVLKIWAGANAISKGDTEGKSGVLAGILIAGAAAIMGALFAIFGLQDAVLTPRF